MSGRISYFSDLPNENFWEPIYEGWAITVITLITGDNPRDYAVHTDLLKPGGIHQRSSDSCHRSLKYKKDFIPDYLHRAGLVSTFDVRLHIDCQRICFLVFLKHFLISSIYLLIIVLLDDYVIK